jgi:beta-lactam-binding protein with PASTA domain
MAQKTLEEGSSRAAGGTKGTIMPDVRGMSLRKVLEVLKEYQVELKVEGTGKAYSQKPLPGTALSRGTLCQIQFRPVL